MRFNPVYFIDPDGMMSLPFGGADTGSFESTGGNGFDVRTYDKENGKTLDFKTVSSLEGVSYNKNGGAISSDGGGNGGLTPPDYFDKDTGDFLGKGDTNEIRFISKQDWKDGKLENYTTYSGDVDVDAAVYAYYAKTYNLIPSGASGTQYCGTLSDGWTTSNYGGILSFNFAPNGIGLDVLNKFDAINVLVHELSTHGEDFINGVSRSNETSWEMRAARAEVQHWSWFGTSPGFKRTSYDYFGKHLSSQEINKYYKPYGIGN